MLHIDDAVPARADERGRTGMPRLISRLYRGARPGARAELLAALTRPLGSLGLMAVASGAFAGFVARRYRGGSMIGLNDAADFTGEQVLELSRFVEQVDPSVFLQVASDIVASPAGFTALGIGAASLILRLYGQASRLEPRPPVGSPTSNSDEGLERRVPR